MLNKFTARNLKAALQKTLVLPLQHQRLTDALALFDRKIKAKIDPRTATELAITKAFKDLKESSDLTKRIESTRKYAGLTDEPTTRTIPLPNATAIRTTTKSVSDKVVALVPKKKTKAEKAAKRDLTPDTPFKVWWDKFSIYFTRIVFGAVFFGVVIGGGIVWLIQTILMMGGTDVPLVVPLTIIIAFFLIFGLIGYVFAVAAIKHKYEDSHEEAIDTLDAEAQLAELTTSSTSQAA